MDLLDLRQVLLPYVAKRNFTLTPEPDATAPMQPKTVVIRDDRLRVFPGNRPPNLGSEKLWRNRSPRPGNRAAETCCLVVLRPLAPAPHGLARAAAPGPADPGV